jgi:cytoskeletal protein CcmA (bactofilin family)
LSRLSSLFVLIALGALALPATAGAGARSDPGDAVVMISGDVTVPRGETVDGVVVASGDVRIAGRSDGDVVVFSGDALVSGRIDGDLVVASGQARLLPSAFVSGDVNYGDERPIVSGRAIVRGEVTEKNWGDSIDFLPFALGIGFWLLMSGSAVLLGCLLLLIAPRAADAIYERSRERIGPLIAIGIAVTICLPLAAVVAAVTVVGIPLGFAILLALLPLAAVAYVTAAWALGRRIVKEPRNRFLSFLAGLGILRLLALVPILGGFAGIAAVVFGFGLIGAAIGAARGEPRPSAPAPARTPGS